MNELLARHGKGEALTLDEYQLLKEAGLLDTNAFGVANSSATGNTWQGARGSREWRRQQASLFLNGEDR